MALAIERRLKRGMFAFTVVDRRYFEDLARYQPADRTFQDLIEAHLPPAWSCRREEIWLKVVPPERPLPAQGFKIHLSATSRSSRDTLGRVLPLLLEGELAFKVVADDFLLDFLNSKNGSRSSSGKFITIYLPEAEIGLDLLPRLEQEVGEAAAPYILTDRRYGDSRAVFYRYGGIRPHFRLNLFGEKEPLLRLPDGSQVLDERAPVFSCPPGIEDPFQPPQVTRSEAADDTDLLRGRYRVLEALQFANSGGVYAGIDVTTGQKVVIKEARPYVSVRRGSDLDAVAILDKEARVLERLQPLLCVPRLLDRFEHWEHSFLVEEYIEGRTLSSYRALDDVGLLVQPRLTAQRVASFCRRFARLGLNLLRAVRACHDLGVLLGDLSPSNVLVDLETLDVTLIDFEGAFLDGDHRGQEMAAVTGGFVSPRRIQGQAPVPEDDYYSLGSVLYSLILPIQAFFPLQPEAQRTMYQAIEHDLDLPAEVGAGLFALLDGEPERARDHLEALLRLPPRPTAWCPRPLTPPDAALQQQAECTLQAIVRDLQACADFERDDRLWPADYRVFTTNPLNLAYGATGIALFQHAVTGRLDERVRGWLLQHLPSSRTCPPGLFVGMAGIACGLTELGLPDAARDVLEGAWQSPLRDEGFDLFYGLAGLGLAHLYFWHTYREPRFLARARYAAQRLEQAAVQADIGCYWTNVDGHQYYGYAHGGSGVALFLLRLHEATGDVMPLALGRRALEHEMSAAVRREGQAGWWRAPDHPLLSPYWRYGAAGVGSVLIRYYQALGDERTLRLAEEAAVYAASRYSVYPGQLLGLAGMGEFLLDLFLATGDSRYHHQAWDLVRSVLHFRVETPHGISFPGEELIRLSTDFATGSAGIGMFLERCLRPRHRFLLDLPAHRKVPGDA